MNSFDPEGRGEIEIVAPVIVGDNTWVASGSIICPGVTIGRNCVIGAGSVVTHDVPDNMLAFGNPCQIIREITDRDRIPNNMCNELDWKMFVEQKDK